MAGERGEAAGAGHLLKSLGVRGESEEGAVGRVGVFHQDELLRAAAQRPLLG